MGLSCPSCDGYAGGPFRRGNRWRIVVHHLPWCATRTLPSFRWWVNRELISAAFGEYDGDDEVQIAHRVRAG